MNLIPWSRPLKIISCTFHSVAIACTVFRLVYRWRTRRLWWDDFWAALALVADVMCLVSASLAAPMIDQRMPPIDLITNWIVTFGFPCVLWACRTSILASIVRVANPSQRLQRLAFLIGFSFLVMWAALIGQRIHFCLTNECIIAGSVGLSQLITDVISDASLVILPAYLLRKTKIDSRQRAMIISAFSASLLITVVTILHSIALFVAHSSGVLVIGHVKTALSLIVCNLLVIVACIYRVCRRGKCLGASEEPVTFTTVDLNTGLTESIMDKRTTMFALHSTASETTTMTAMATEEVEEKVQGRVGPMQA